jgi:hypothetical protein
MAGRGVADGIEAGRGRHDGRHPDRAVAGNPDAERMSSTACKLGRAMPRRIPPTHARRLAALLTLAASTSAGAQRTPADSAGASVIRAIEIRRESVFGADEARFWGYRLLNALHADTRPHVIRRELLFAAGEPYDEARVAESERNLRSLRLFRDVAIDTVRTDSGLVVRVHTLDAWTTTVNFGVRSSGSQSVFDASVSEANFLGTGTEAALTYVNDPDRSAILVGFDAPRAIAHRVGVGATYLDRSDGHAGALSLRYPFLSLSARRGASLGVQFFDGRVLQFVGGTGRIVTSLSRKFSVVRLEGAVAPSASPRGYVRLGWYGQLRREDFAPRELTTPIPRTVTAASGPTLAMRAPRFIRTRNVQYMGRVEDFDLGPQLRASVLLAPASWGYERTGVGTSVAVASGVRVPTGFAQATVSLSALTTAYGTDSASAEGAASIVLQPGTRHLLVMSVSGGVQRRPAPGSEFDLGLGAGLRAYPAHAFTGDRYYLTGAEYRVLVWPGLLGLVGVGAAVFADHAGAWFGGSPRRTGSEAGVGLRFASLREAGSVWRVDLSRRAANDVAAGGWVVSIGRGFVFHRS